VHINSVFDFMLRQVPARIRCENGYGDPSVDQPSRHFADVGLDAPHKWGISRRHHRYVQGHRYAASIIS
jgi:hypothetical protein